MVNKKREVISDIFDTRVDKVTRTIHAHPVHKRHVDVSFTAKGNELVLELELYEDLLNPETYHVIFGGAHNEQERIVYGVEHCYYKGKVSGNDNSWLAVSTCTGVLEGMVHVGNPDKKRSLAGVETEDGVTYFLTATRKREHLKEGESARHIVYTADDVAGEKPVFQCGVDHEHEGFEVKEMVQDSSSCFYPLAPLNPPPFPLLRRRLPTRIPTPRRRGLVQTSMSSFSSQAILLGQLLLAKQLPKATPSPWSTSLPRDTLRCRRTFLFSLIFQNFYSYC